jgi:hypothetical protein
MYWNPILFARWKNSSILQSQPEYYFALLTSIFSLCKKNIDNQKNAPRLGISRSALTLRRREVFVPHPFHKSLQPWAPRLPLRKMRIMLPMSYSINLVVRRWAVSIALVSIIESAISQSDFITSEAWFTYLYPRSLYAMAADWMICAVADFPTPEFISTAIVVWFKIFPVKMNVLDAVEGSWEKPNTACCAATNTLVVLMFRSRVKFAKGMEPRGSFASFGGMPAPAAWT